MMVNNYFDSIGQFDIDVSKVNELSPLVLAYIGDIVYEIYVRTMLVHRYKLSVHKLHMKSIKYVSANAQADIMRKISCKLTEDEISIFKRGRNAKSNTVPKNMSIIDYRYATGFETLIGFLYLKKNFSRLEEIMNLSIASVGND